MSNIVDCFRALQEKISAESPALYSAMVLELSQAVSSQWKQDSPASSSAANGNGGQSDALFVIESSPENEAETEVEDRDRNKDMDKERMREDSVQRVASFSVTPSMGMHVSASASASATSGEGEPMANESGPDQKRQRKELMAPTLGHAHDLAAYEAELAQFQGELVRIDHLLWQRRGGTKKERQKEKQKEKVKVEESSCEHGGGPDVQSRGKPSIGGVTPMSPNAAPKLILSHLHLHSSKGQSQEVTPSELKETQKRSNKTKTKNKQNSKQKNQDSSNSNSNNSNGAKKERQIVIVASKCGPVEQKALNTLQSQVASITMASDVTESVTHIVTAVDSGGYAARTLKLMQGLTVPGIWIVAAEWVEACLKADGLVEEEAWEIKGLRERDHHRILKGGAALVRQARRQLFAGENSNSPPGNSHSGPMRVCFWDSVYTKAPPLEDCIDLALRSGCIVLPVEQITPHVIVFVNDNAVSRRKWAESNINAHALKISYLLDSICLFKQLDRSDSYCL
jgi:hypothetical protein